MLRLSILFQLYLTVALVAPRRALSSQPGPPLQLQRRRSRLRRDQALLSLCCCLRSLVTPRLVAQRSPAMPCSKVQALVVSPPTLSMSLESLGIRSLYSTPFMELKRASRTLSGIEQRIFTAGAQAGHLSRTPSPLMSLLLLPRQHLFKPQTPPSSLGFLCLWIQVERA